MTGGAAGAVASRMATHRSCRPGTRSGRTAAPVLYLSGGGFALARRSQLDRVEEYLRLHRPGRAGRVQVDAGQRLLREPYPLAGQAVEGLEIEGRLAGTDLPQGRSTRPDPGTLRGGRSVETNPMLYSPCWSTRWSAP